MMRLLILPLLWSLFALLPASLLAHPRPGIEHVLVVGVDGLSPDGIRQSDTPTLDSLMQRGASTLTAQAVMPSSSSPNWASIIMGAPPALHTVTSNDWEPADIRDSVFCGNEPGQHWPTIFRVLRETYPDADLACFYDWSGFGRLVEPGVATVLSDTRGEDRTAREATHYLGQHQPLFTFVHLDHVDHTGHAHRWGSPEYKAAVEKADRLIGQIVQGLRQAEIADNTVILVTSDHGGAGTSHGGDSPAEVTIPWIIAGPGIQAGATVADSVRTFDTAATVAYLLGATPPDCWVGQPITSILTSEGYATQPQD